MGNGFQFLDIILFAMVAAFLVLRLRSVLGKRTGHQRERPNPIARRQDVPTNGDARDAELLPDVDPGPREKPDDPVEAGVTSIRIADPSFSPDEFMEGAVGAFEMIVQAFAKADTDALEAMLSADVYDNFRDAIDRRLEAEETLDTTIIDVKSARIAAAEMVRRDAIVTVEFVSTQVNVTRDSEGRIIAGDPNEITEITDIWKFQRDTKSRDPNWKLVETRSQS